MEDDRMIGQILSLSLQRGKYRVLLADCGAEAMEIAGRYPNGIDVIVTDVLLGKEEGPVIAGVVRQFSPDAMLLLISGYPLEILYDKNILRPQYLEDGKATFLQKPFLSNTFVEIVNDMLAAGSGEGDKHASAAY